MMAHACNPNTREIRRSRKRSFGWSQLHSETLLQTNKQTNKNGGPSWEKRELLLAMTLGSNSLDLLLLNKSDTSQAYDQVRSRLPSAACMGCPHSARVSPGRILRRALFGASCWFHIHLLYVPQNQIHPKIPIPVALK